MPEERPEWNPGLILAAGYRAAVTGADAYRAVRSALRIDRGILRVGNRFLPASRVREIAFLALGNASASLALAASESLGERLTQGFVAGPVALPESVPFRSVRLPSALPGSAAGAESAHAVLELAGDLGESDLLVVLLSPGALGALSLPPEGLDGPAWGRLLERLAREHGPALASRLARVAGRGATGGRLAAVTSARLETLVVEDGSGGASIGGAPTLRPDPAERLQLRAELSTLPGLPESLRTPAPEPLARPVPALSRPVVVASPADAIRSAGDALVDRRWITRLGILTTDRPPEEAAQLLVRRSEEELRALGGRLPRSGGRGSGSSAGLAVFAGVTLGGVEGAPPAGAASAFLDAAYRALPWREAVVA
ncbi:MAG: DUF4147 domain-containing protein, partial [Thermoplasmata archaeon]|nr:DUF4147 domain-containing protein [Thermoplasmata archaeon]